MKRLMLVAALALTACATPQESFDPWAGTYLPEETSTYTYTPPADRYQARLDAIEQRMNRYDNQSRINAFNDQMREFEAWSEAEFQRRRAWIEQTRPMWEAPGSQLPNPLYPPGPSPYPTW